MAMPLRTFAYPRKRGTPRPAETYRGARRNAARGTVWRGAPVCIDEMARPPAVRPNRTRRFEPRWGKQALKDATGKIVRYVWLRLFDRL